jgi:hypothetical protein
MDKTFTYRKLDQKLRALGFTVHMLEGNKGRFYKHEETGASIILPARPFDAEVLWHHVALARHVLDDYGLGELDEVRNSHR